MTKRAALWGTILIVAAAVAYVAIFGLGGNFAVFILSDAVAVVIACAFFLRSPDKPVEKPQ